MKSTSISSSGVLRLSASAGSGKTYSLTQLYLRQVLHTANAFRTVVAITFTNKAANELKERILNRLEELTHSEKADDVYTEFGFESGEKLAKRARTVLLRIVHDFDAFRVMTIDSFFHLLFSQLAFDAGLPAGLQLELDQNRVRSEALAEGLKSIDPMVQQILLENVLKVLGEKGKGWRPVRYLEESLMHSLFQDEVLNFQYTHEKEWLSDGRITQARTAFETYLEEENQVITEAARALQTACRNLGINTSRFNQTDYKDFYGELNQIDQLAAGKGERARRKESNAKGKFWRPKEVSKEDLESLSPLLIDLYESMNPERVGNIALAESVLKNLTAIRLLLFFRSIVVTLNASENRILLAEVKYILRGMVKGSDVPYLYEKLGNQLTALLIDEFQDTDGVQWSVLAPLAKTIADQGGFFAVVGDVKQSIYGWRGGDSSLFKSGVDASLAPNPVEEHPLETNYRSHARIVKFNNWLFTHIPDLVAGNLREAGYTESDEVFTQWQGIFTGNYEDARQLIQDKYKTLPDQGFVEMRVHQKPAATEPKDEGEEDTEPGRFDWMVPDIVQLQTIGIAAGEIAILVRNNKDLGEVVRLFDRTRRENTVKGDFTFTAQSADKVGDHSLLQFLASVLQSLPRPSPFQWVLLEELARTLELDSRFYDHPPGEIPAWRATFLQKIPDDPQSDLLRNIDRVTAFFELDRFAEHQFGITTFKNLVITYLQQESAAYPDFTSWWLHKASNQTLALPEASKGIRIMTIHKSKGLDFGVVILAINSSTKSDELTNFDFWPASDAPPWNAFPLLKAKARAGFLHSDLGPAYEDKVYRQVLENLNLWYVALTRPRYGLIIDICLGVKDNLETPEKSSKKLARLPILIPYQMMELEDEINRELVGSMLEKDRSDSNQLFHFRYGEWVKPPEKEHSPMERAVHLPKTLPLRNSLVPWSVPDGENEETLQGKLIHTVLEKTYRYETWRGNFQQVQQHYHKSGITPGAWKEMEIQLEKLFENDQMKSWFSSRYETLPEQEMWSEGGKLLRADRILKDEAGYVLLDFKSGQQLNEHIQQIGTYAGVLERISGKAVKCYLVYINPQEIKEISGVTE